MRRCASLPLLAVALASRAAFGSGAASVSYSLPEDARVSLGIYDSTGVLVRTLSAAEPQQAGTHVVEWDGRDSSGSPAPAGTYTWKAVTSQGLRAEYLMSVGTSFGWRTWVGNHRAPEAVACDGQRIAIGGQAEGPPALAAIDLDGGYLWHHDTLEPAVGVARLAWDTDRLDVLVESGDLYSLRGSDGSVVSSVAIRLPARSLGAVAPFTTSERDVTAAVPDGTYLLEARVGAGAPSGASHVGVRGSAEQVPAIGAGQTQDVIAPRLFNGPYPFTVTDGGLTVKVVSDRPGEAVRIDDLELLAPATSFDARSHEVVAAFASAQAIGWVDPTTGRVSSTAKVASPGEIALAGPGVALVLSEGRVLAVRRDHAGAKVLIDGLVEPSHLAVDPKSGDILVAEGGASQQILRFSRGGRRRHAYGRRGGREEGLYQPEDFQAVSGVAADGRGGFVVTESDSAPRRTARFDAAGHLLSEQYGGQLYFTFAAFDPADPSRLWFDSHWGWIAEAQLDYARRTWRIRATYRLGNVGGVIPTKQNGPGGWVVRHHGGDTYLVTQQVEPSIVRVDEAGRRLVPVMTSRWQFIHYWSQEPAVFRALLGDVAPTHGPSFVSWSDADGDGVMAASELRYASWSTWNPHAWWVDDAFSAHLAWQPDGHAPLELDTWSPASWSKGVPVYESLDGAKRLPLPALGSVIDLSQDADGSTYLVLHGGGDGYVARAVFGMAHDSAWPANLSDGAALARLSPSGSLLWRAGSLGSDATTRHPGRLADPERIAGFAHGCVAVAERVQEPCTVWTKDGLFVGSVFDQLDTRSAPADAYFPLLNADRLMGGAIAELPGGDVIFAAQGWSSVPLYRVTGWDRLRRLEGTVALRKRVDAPAGKGTGLAAELFADPELHTPTARRTDGRLWFEPEPSRGHPWPQAGAPASGRWQGWVEPRFSEGYTFGVYTGGGGARLWIDGKLVADSWTTKDAKASSPPIPLQARVKVPIKIEWRRAAAEPELHLVWESLSQQVEHIPTAAMYSAAP